MTIPIDHIQTLMQLFGGYSEAYGQCNINEPHKPGLKTPSRCWTVDGTAGLSHWDAHVKGEGPGLGIIPLRDDNTVTWGAIDIDDYADLDFQRLERKIKQRGADMTIFRSKSGGAHLITFFSSPLPATKAVAYLKVCVKILGLPAKTEIFPKQTRRTGPDDKGNWLNMPYYGDIDGGRYAILNGQPLTLADFIKEMSHEEN